MEQGWLVFVDGIDHNRLEALQDKFHDLVLESFPHGMRPTSLLDRRKFCVLFKEKHGVCPLADNDAVVFGQVARAACLEVSGKFYAVSPQARANLAALLKSFWAAGVNIVYFSRLYQTHVSEFSAWGIASAEVLAQTIRKHFQVRVEGDYCHLVNTESLEDEIIRKWGDEPLLSLVDLAKQLPLVPAERIRKALSATKFLVAGSGQYLNVDAVVFAEAEVEAAMAAVRLGLEKDGFFLAGDLEFLQSHNLDPGVPAALLPKAFYCKFLSRQCVWKNGVISSRARKVNPRDMIRAYCQNRNSFTYGELRGFVRDRLERAHDRIFLEIAREMAVQVDADNFANKADVDFDVANIDDALALLTQNKPVPVALINDLSLLPVVPGYPWNTWLLMSYCRLKSARFRIHQPAPVNCRVGIISPASSCEDYHKLAAQIAIAAGIEPNPEAVGRYAVQSGLFATQRKAAVANVVTAMRQMGQL